MARFARLILGALLVWDCAQTHAGEVQSDLATNASWSAFAGVPGGGRYSALAQINRENVGELKVAWVHHTGDLWNYGEGRRPTSYEVTPIHANGHLYLCTPLNRILALDPETGAEKWAFDPHAGLI